MGKLTFSKPDNDTFPLLRLALEAIASGGAVPAVLNAANEVAVSAFLNRKIGFCGIFELVEEVVTCLRTDAAGAYSIDAVFEYDSLARSYANEQLSRRA